MGIGRTEFVLDEITEVKVSVSLLYAFDKMKKKKKLVELDGESVVLIEVQIGDYLGKDDIVRFDDLYRRP